MIIGFIPVSILLVLLLFLYWRIAGGLSLFPSKHRPFAFLFILFGLFLILIFFFNDARIPAGLLGAAGIIMGTIMMAGSLFILEFILSFVFPDIKKAVVWTALVLAVLTSVFSYVKAIAPPKVRNIQIPLRGFPERLAGFSIVQLSDLHLRPSVPVGRLEHIVESANALNPDVIVLTGDILGGLYRDIEKYAKILDKLQAEFGVFAVYGNNEFNNSGRNFQKFLDLTSIRVLRNENVQLRNGVQLAGIDDQKGLENRRIDAGPDLEKALEKIDPDMPVVLLSHRAHFFDDARKFGIDLQLSGHTHAGQIFPLDLLCRLYYTYPYGLYRLEDAYLYTSSGAGTWPYLPMRLFSSNEIVRLTLEQTQ